MYFFKDKLVPLDTNIVSIYLDDIGYLYMDLEVYNKLYSSKLSDSDIEKTIYNKLGKQNRELFVKELEKDALCNIKNFALLIENDMSEYTIEDYLNSIGFIFTNAQVIANPITDLIDLNISFRVPKENSYSYSKQKFEQSCLKEQDINITTIVGLTGQQITVGTQISQDMQQSQQTSSVDIPEWRQLIDKYGKEIYIGCGSLNVPGLGFYDMDVEETKECEKYINWVDPEPIVVKKEEPVPVATRPVETGFAEEGDCATEGPPEYLLSVLNLKGV